MDTDSLMRLSAEELQAEAGTALPAKEVISLLDLNIDVDLALALAAPIDLAVAANANVALPIDAAVSANVLSSGSTAAAGATQGVMIDQLISGQAIAHADQTAAIDQPDAGGTDGAAGAGADAGNTDGEAGSAGTGGAASGSSDAAQPAAGAAPAPTEPAANVVDDVGGALDGGLLNVDAQVSLDADLAAPVAGAVAANANVAAPIDAAVAANVGSVDSEAVAVADQTAIVNQNLQDVTAEATAEQDSEVGQ